MGSPNKILEFRKQKSVEHKVSTDSSTYSKYDIIESNDGSGGGKMGYVTREEFNAKMEAVNIKIDSLEKKIDLTGKNIVNEIKLYINDKEKEQNKLNRDNKRWIIGSIIIPTLIVPILVPLVIYLLRNLDFIQKIFISNK